MYWSAASVCVQVTMSSSESKRSREQTSPTGNNPYAASKKSAREATLEFLEAGEDCQVWQEVSREEDQVQLPPARKLLFQLWTRGEEKPLCDVCVTALLGA